jgi:ADP-heptose:LPS heptosyltransferase
MFKAIKSCLVPNPLDRFLKKSFKEGKSSFLVYWNRGLGDIPLGLYALCHRIRKKIPEARIVFLTRVDLAEAFTMLEDIEVIVDQKMQRGKVYDLKQAPIAIGDFDRVIEKVPNKWIEWQLGKLIPKLKWNPTWDQLVNRFGLGNDKNALGVHVSSETSAYYGYEKNWSARSFQALFDRIAEETGQKILLFGMKKEIKFSGNHLLDLRGDTTLFEMLSLIKNCCSHLLAPDSGVLSVTYYIDALFPLKVVSLWADPRQGILRQKVVSPNGQLTHIPLIGAKECVENISIEQVFKSLYG